jgi:hypothetical protein
VVNNQYYYYSVSVVYPCGESASSTPASAYPVVPTPYVRVQSITMTWVASGNRYKARAVVNVVNRNGVPVSGATVFGSFTGTINNAGLSGVTAANGGATITSTSAIRNGTVTLTVTDISSTAGYYNSQSNTITSATISR